VPDAEPLLVSRDAVFYRLNLTAYTPLCLVL
jgi:hypothetical protein